MTLSDDNRKALLLHIHNAIADSSETIANDICSGQVETKILYPPDTYPPSRGFSAEELAALKQLANNDNLRSALQKILAEHTAGVLFHLFAIIDGVGEPFPDFGQWRSVMLVDMPEDYDEHYEFLHDEFYATYWDWEARGEITRYPME